MKGCLASMLLALCLLVVACRSATAPASPPPNGAVAALGSVDASAQAAPIVYAAIGASDSVGAGAGSPLREAWPQLFYNLALPTSAVMYNFASPGALLSGALSQQLPRAVAVHPAVVTVWLAVDDLREGVSPADYEAQLDQLLQSLRQAGVHRVLVANTPYVDRLPAYLRCQAGGSFTAACELPPPAQVNPLVEQYNAAIARVTSKEGAILVDLHGEGELPDLHPTWVSSDGFHPSALGYLNIARKFATALQAAGGP